MTSLDGNYLKMQGEALARMQVAYQAESQAQQVRAQAASEKAIQRLREEVLAMASSEGQDRGMAPVGSQGGAPPKGQRRGRGPRSEGPEGAAAEASIGAPDDGRGSRLDVRA